VILNPIYRSVTCVYIQIMKPHLEYNASEENILNNPSGFSYDLYCRIQQNKKPEFIPFTDNTMTSMNCVANFLDQLLSKTPVGVAALSNLLDFLTAAIANPNPRITKHLLHKTGQIILKYYHKVCPKMSIKHLTALTCLNIGFIGTLGTIISKSLDEIEPVSGKRFVANEADCRKFAEESYGITTKANTSVILGSLHQLSKNKSLLYFFRIGDAMERIQIKSETARKKYLQNTVTTLKSVNIF